MFWKATKLQPRFIEYRVVSKNMTLKVAFFKGEVYLTQKQLSDILGLRIPTINEHLKKILMLPEYPAAEFSEEFPLKADDGKTYQVKHYRAEILEEIQRRARR
jgi:hypothetical protein